MTYDYDRSVVAETNFGAYGNRLEGLQATFTSEIGKRLFGYIEMLHGRLRSREPYDNISGFLSWDYGAARPQGDNKWAIRVWQKSASTYPGELSPNILVSVEFEKDGKVSYEAKAGSESLTSATVGSTSSSSSSIGMRIGEAWETKLTGSVDYGRFASTVEAVSTGAQLEVVMRKGQWPPDMFRKGGVLNVVKGGSSGDVIKIKERGDVMSGGHEFKLEAGKDSTFVLESTNDKFKRALKVKLKD